jgi:hypothetical protein
VSLFRSQFGEPWDDPRLAEVPRGSTPVGQECMHCGQAVQAGDLGVILLATEQEGPARQTPAPLHRQCIDRWLP